MRSFWRCQSQKRERRRVGLRAVKTDDLSPKHHIEGRSQCQYSIAAKARTKRLSFIESAGVSATALPHVTFLFEFAASPEIVSGIQLTVVQITMPQ